MASDLDNAMDFQAYYSEHVSSAQLKGDQLTGLCPFHEDKNPSFSVDVKTGKWICRSQCGSGNATTFHAKKFHGGDNKKAYADLCTIYGVESSGKKKKKNSENDLEEIFSYLHGKRKLSKDIIQQSLDAEDLFYMPKYGRDKKPVIGTQFRSVKQVKVTQQYDPMDGTDKKFKKGKPADGFFQVGQSLNDPDMIIIVEAVINAMSIADSYPKACCLAIGGTSHTKKLAGLKSYPKKIVCFFDNDTPGNNATIKTKKILKDCDCKTVIWAEDAPKGYDANDLLKSDNKEAIVKMIQEASEIVQDEKPEEETAPPEKKISKADGRVIKEKGCYTKQKLTSQGWVPDGVASNFTFTIERTIKTPSTIIREVSLIPKSGSKPTIADLPPPAMASKQIFTSWCYDQGNFSWTGTMKDLEAVIEMEINVADQRMIQQPDHIGFHTKDNLWLFGDSAIKDSEIYLPDESGTIWIDEEGYQPISLNADENESSISLFPIIRHDMEIDEVDYARKEIIKLLKQNLGGFEAYVALGYVAACAYRKEIFRRYKFPLLFLSGKKGCGKNTLASVIMAHFGLSEDIAENASKATKVALSRKLSYYSSIPVWLDEYRSADKDCSKLNSIIRSAFDGVSGSAGKLGFGVNISCVRAPIIITGESFPTDAALASRCVQLTLSETHRDDKCFKQITKLMPMLSGIFHKIIKEKTPEKTKKLFKDIDFNIEAMKDKVQDSRVAVIHSIFGECFQHFYGYDDVNQDQKEFGHWSLSHAETAHEETSESTALSEFYSDIEVMAAEGILNGGHGLIEDGKAYLWLQGIYNLWVVDRNKRNAPVWSMNDIKNHMKDEKYYVPQKGKRLDLKRLIKNGNARRSAILSMNGDMPDNLKTKLENIWLDSNETSSIETYHDRL